jgi:hypothetical protein
VEENKLAANENTKFQINYKLADGTLINLYAADVRDLETGLTDLSMVSALIKSTSAELSGGNATASAVAAITQQFPAAQPVAVTSTGQDAASSVKMCKHGQMSYRTGTGQKGPWQGYMCAAPKGAPDKCETIWVR